MLQKIEWRDIFGYKGLYQVSSCGMIRSLDRIVWNGKCYHTHKGRILKLQSNLHYNKVSLSKEGKVKQHLVHRLVAMAFLPNPKRKEEVNHKDYNCYNNHVDNLEWVSSKENDSHKRNIYKNRDTRQERLR